MLRLAEGMAAPQIARLLELTPQAIRKIAHRYREGGLERALYEKQRPGAAELLDDLQKQRIVAMVCSEPPEGPGALDSAISNENRRSSENLCRA